MPALSPRACHKTPADLKSWRRRIDRGDRHDARIPNEGSAQVVHRPATEPILFESVDIAIHLLRICNSLSGPPTSCITSASACIAAKAGLSEAIQGRRI